MKPNPKNKVYCSDSGKSKMLFETEKKANNFIKFNAEEIEAESGYSPKRSYYCTFCGGYHVTSREGYAGVSRKEQFLEEYRRKSMTYLARFTHPIYGSRSTTKQTLQAVLDWLSYTIAHQHITDISVYEVDAAGAKTKIEVTIPTW